MAQIDRWVLNFNSSFMQKVPPKPPSWCKSAKTKNEGKKGHFWLFFGFCAFSPPYMANFCWSKFVLNLEVPTHPMVSVDFFSAKRFGLHSCSKYGHFGRFLPFFHPNFPKFAIFCLFSGFCAFSQPFMNTFPGSKFVLNLEVCTHPKL